MTLAVVLVIWCSSSVSCKWQARPDGRRAGDGHTRNCVSRVRAAEDAAGSHDTEIRHWDEYLVGSADHDHVPALQAQPLQAEGKSLDPSQQLSGRETLLVIFAIDPCRLVARLLAFRKQVGEKICLGDVKIRERRCKDHLGGWDDA